MKPQGKLSTDFDLLSEELTSQPPYRFEMNRRDFCRALGGGILVVLLLPESLVGQEESSRAGRRRASGDTDQVGTWIHIGQDGKIEAFTGKIEGGQGARTELGQSVADELRVPMDAVHMTMGDTDLTPFDAGTFGSQTTPRMVPQLRRAAAAAREALVDLAAEKWNVPREKLDVGDGMVVHAESGRKAGFGELTKGQAITRTITDSEPVTPAEAWTVAGKPVAAVNGPDIVKGKHKYPSDLHPEGMLFGRVLRPAAFGATLEKLDDAEARKLPGVVVVREGDFVGVAAPTPGQASRALDALKAEWSTPDHAKESELFEYLKKHPGESRGWRGRSAHETGSVEEGLKAAAAKLDATYTVAYIAHAPLEPRAAVAEWKDGKLTAWVGTQRPFGVRSELARTFSLEEGKVRVLMPDMGSGYGGKHTGEVAVEAARLAKAAGKPVKVVWSRPEEFTWAYFRPAGVIDVKSGAAKDGRLTAWEFHNYNSGPAAIRTPYDVPNQKIEYHPVDSPLRQGSYRALAATANFFARESHMDEVAAALKMDPVEFRLKNLKDDRIRAVVEAAAKAFGWEKRKKTPDHGFGMGCGTEKAGFVATFVEVHAPSDLRETRIVRATTAFECGAIVNPDNLRNQIEGCVIMAIGGALFEAIHFDDGKITNDRFSKYRVPRFSDVPKLETIIVNRKDLPSVGAGECPMLGLAPAVANAIFDAAGKRLRSMPLVPRQAT